MSLEFEDNFSVVSTRRKGDRGTKRIMNKMGKYGYDHFIALRYYQNDRNSRLKETTVEITTEYLYRLLEKKYLKERFELVWASEYPKDKKSILMVPNTSPCKTWGPVSLDEILMQLKETEWEYMTRKYYTEGYIIELIDLENDDLNTYEKVFNSLKRENPDIEKIEDFRDVVLEIAFKDYHDSLVFDRDNSPCDLIDFKEKKVLGWNGYGIEKIPAIKTLVQSAIGNHLDEGDFDFLTLP